MKQAKTPAPRRVRAAAVIPAGPRYARRIMFAQWGAPCPDIAAGCITCEAWAAFNGTRGRTAPRWSIAAPWQSAGEWRAVVGGMSAARWSGADVRAMRADEAEWAAAMIGVLYQSNAGFPSVFGPFPTVDAAAAWGRAELGGEHFALVSMHAPDADASTRNPEARLIAAAKACAEVNR